VQHDHTERGDDYGPLGLRGGDALSETLSLGDLVGGDTHSASVASPPSDLNAADR
jgi:hypothetical protein